MGMVMVTTTVRLPVESVRPSAYVAGRYQGQLLSRLVACKAGFPYPLSLLVDPVDSVALLPRPVLFDPRAAGAEDDAREDKENQDDETHDQVEKLGNSEEQERQ
jgi:hypothetical protein